MTPMLHQLRHHSRALANGLLVVLLATWLSTVCQHCLAQALDEPAPSSHCQQHAPAPSEEWAAAHDCCPQAASQICDGGDCMQVSSVINSEPLTVIATTNSPDVLPPSDVFSHVYTTIPPPDLIVVDTIITDPCPRYLRNCVFRI